MKRTITFLSLFLWLLNPILAQQTISGKVLDGNNQPFIGATVAVLNSSIGIITIFSKSSSGF